jgi:hypothetical protein
MRREDHEVKKEEDTQKRGSNYLLIQNVACCKSTALVIPAMKKPPVVFISIKKE